MKKHLSVVFLCLLVLSFLLQSCVVVLPENSVADVQSKEEQSNGKEEQSKDTDFSIPESYTPPKAENPTPVDVSTLPSFSGEPYVAVNGNIPNFSDDELVPVSYEDYSPLDELGRCGVTIACVGIDLMPTDQRESIGSVKPTGWQTVKYDIVDGKYLYNRCHLIGFQLSGENANKQNLITGTRYLNIKGMLPFENMVADYVKETKNHVLYRVTPIFVDDELVARGVQIEGYSIEDDGDGICFNVFAYNVQPNIEIDYKTGDSRLVESEESKQTGETTYILNTNTKKFHLPSCSSADNISENNRSEYSGSRDQLIKDGYSPCGRCNP